MGGQTIYADVDQLHGEHGNDDDESPFPWMKFDCPVL